MRCLLTAAAEPHFVSQLAAARLARDGWAEANAYHMLGQVRRYQHRYHDANVQFERALEGFQSAGDPDGAASVVNSLGEVARDAGQAAVCRSLFRRALHDHYRIGSKRATLHGSRGSYVTETGHAHEPAPGPGGCQRLTVSRENPDAASMSNREVAVAQPGGVSTVPPAIPVRVWLPSVTNDAPPPTVT